jgi:hypothetical protein
MKKDTYSYKGWLLSDNILKRSLAIVGHHLIIIALFYGVVLIIAALIYVVRFALG